MDQEQITLSSMISADLPDIMTTRDTYSSTLRSWAENEHYQGLTVRPSSPLGSLPGPQRAKLHSLATVAVCWQPSQIIQYRLY